MTSGNTLEVLERLAASVGWDPMDALEGLRDPLSKGVRLLLLDEVQQMLDRLRNMTRWLQSLDPALEPIPRAVTQARAERTARRGRPSRSDRPAAGRRKNSVGV